MSVLNKNHFKDISIKKDNHNSFDELMEKESEIETKKTRGRPKKTNKKDCTYTFYCTKEELKELALRAEKRYLSMSEYFRMRLFAE